MNYYGMKITLFIKKQAGKKLTMLTQLPFHKDKDFQQLNFFMLMFIVPIVHVNIAGCLEYLDYQRQSKVPNPSRPVS